MAFWWCRTLDRVSSQRFSPWPVSMRRRFAPRPRRYVFVPWRVNCLYSQYGCALEVHGRHCEIRLFIERGEELYLARVPTEYTNDVGADLFPVREMW